MFLHKWTLQVSRQGQNEELSFSTKEEALREADKLFESASQEDPVTLILIDPDNKEDHHLRWERTLTYGSQRLRFWHI